MKSGQDKRNQLISEGFKIKNSIFKDQSRGWGRRVMIPTSVRIIIELLCFSGTHVNLEYCDSKKVETVPS